MSAYLDHAASTPMRPEAIAAMLPFLAEAPGNPSGSHGASRVAKTALEEARETVAAVCGAAPGETQRLAAEGFRTTTVPATGDGRVDLDALTAALDERTAVVSVMSVNN